MPDAGKTVRFAAVVKSAGAPVTYALWSDPRRDPKFKRALGEIRIMTVHREMRGAHKDHGEIGHHPDRHAQFLLFPKSLRRFADRRIVGIDYDLLAEKTETVAGIEPELIESAVAQTPAQPTRTPAIAVAAPANRVVRFPRRNQKNEPRPKKSSALPPRPVPSGAVRTKLAPVVMAEIRSALRELKKGRNVAAYARLAGLLAAP